MALTLRKIRLRSVWLIVIPFFWFARPTQGSLLIGAGLTAFGLAIRAAAAGFIHKEDTLTTTGPYAFTRNPLYLGSFLLGLGVTVAGGLWQFVVIFAVFFTLVYTATIRGEARLLAEKYPQAYPEYAENVPLFIPRPSPYRAPGVGSAAAFSGARWRGNKEYEALLGAVLGFAVLIARMQFGS